MIAFLISSLRCAAFVAQPRHAVDHVDDQVEARGLVQHRQLERRVDVALLLVAADVQVLVALEAIGELVNEPRVAVEVEDDRLVGGEQAVELALRRAVRMLGRRLQLEQVDDVDEAQLQIGQRARAGSRPPPAPPAWPRRRRRPAPRRAPRRRRCWPASRCRGPWCSGRSPRRWW